jgi:hypothetical protein
MTALVTTLEVPDNPADHFNGEPRGLVVYELVGAEVFAAPSDSSDRIYTVIVHAGHASCSCPARVPCKHIRRVLAARAGF